MIPFFKYKNKKIQLKKKTILKIDSNFIHKYLFSTPIYVQTKKKLFLILN